MAVCTSARLIACRSACSSERRTTASTLRTTRSIRLTTSVRGAVLLSGVPAVLLPAVLTITGRSTIPRSVLPWLLSSVRRATTHTAALMSATITGTPTGTASTAAGISRIRPTGSALRTSPLGAPGSGSPVPARREHGVHAARGPRSRAHQRQRRAACHDPRPVGDARTTWMHVGRRPRMHVEPRRMMPGPPDRDRSSWDRPARPNPRVAGGSRTGWRSRASMPGALVSRRRSGASSLTVVTARVAAALPTEIRGNGSEISARRMADRPEQARRTRRRDRPRRSRLAPPVAMTADRWIVAGRMRESGRRDNGPDTPAADPRSSDSRSGEMSGVYRPEPRSADRGGDRGGYRGGDRGSYSPPGGTRHPHRMGRDARRRGWRR